ncbi:MAG: transporter, partial [Candidatus Binatia bacterium]
GKGLSTGKADETLLLIATKSLKPFAIHANFGYTIVGDGAGSNLKNVLRGGIAMEWVLNPRWSLVGELTGMSRTASAESNQADFQIGFRYALQPTLVLDFAAGRSLRTSGTTAQGTFGLTWTVDLSKLTQR